MEQQIRALREVLGKAERVAALTGAGISAESGVPTFRGADGLWRNCNNSAGWDIVGDHGPRAYQGSFANGHAA